MDRSRGQANIIKRYLWLLETLSTHNRITYKEISDLWQRSYGMPLPHKTFENHRIAVEEIYSVKIECDRSTNEYFIASCDMSESETRLHEMMNSAILLKNLMSSSDLARYVHLEKIHGGNEFLQTVVLSLTKSGTPLKYRHNYDSSKEEEVTVKPIGIKMFRQRWYLIAEKPRWQTLFLLSGQNHRGDKRRKSKTVKAEY